MKKFVFAVLLTVVAVLATAQTRTDWDKALYREILQSICLPQTPAREFPITNYGAKSVNTAASAAVASSVAAKNQKAIQKAIDKCAGQGGGRVIVPRGQHFLTGAIALKSGVNLVVEEGAVLEFVFQPELYPIVETSWEGLDCYNLSPCIYAFQAHDIAVTGCGTIDGGGTRETWWPWCGAAKYGWREGMTTQKLEARPRLLRSGEDGIPMTDGKGRRSPERTFTARDGLRPQLVCFNQCQRVLVEDVTLLRSPFWVLHPLKSDDVTVRRVRIENDGPNGDGCDPESCNRVLIEDCFFNTGDDCIAIKSGRNSDGRRRGMMSQNIIVRNCTMKNGHGGVVIGSEISGGCRNVFAHDCVMDSPNLDRVLRIKTNSCRGGVIEHIYMRNIRVGQCGESVLKINLDYEHNEICCRGHYPTVRHVLMENVTCQRSKYGVQIIGLYDDTFVHDITVRNCRFDGVGQGNTIKGKTRNITFDSLYINGTLTTEPHPAEASIDRQAVVSRHHPVVTQADPLAALSVGNGHFATTVDVTGLQSYPRDYETGVPLTAMADWGWHRFPNPQQLQESESWRTFRFPHRRHDEVYAVEYKQGGRQQAATQYYRANPHRLNLGTIGLDIRTIHGNSIPLQQLANIRQVQHLYDGVIHSAFTADDVPVNVITTCLWQRDATAYHIQSPLLKDGRAAVSIRFSYPTGRHADDANDWTQPGNHRSSILQATPHSAVIERTLDDTRYYLTLRWAGNATLEECAPHSFMLKTKASFLTFEAEYTSTPPSLPGLAGDEAPFVFDQQLKATQRAWNNFWQTDGVVDFSRCTDPRAAELERRVVLSQYLTRINCANSMPPQETGLTYNSWFGRPHLEMALWHGLHFSLWGRTEILRPMLDWYNDTALPVARSIARRQGFKGVRWMKMTDPWAGEAPSNTGSFLIWQQPHYLYIAEEIYRRQPTAETLRHYAPQVEETAAFMADFVCREGSRYTLRGATAMQESMSKDFSYNHPFELAYWHYGLQLAQTWRERQGLDRHPEWDDILQHLSPLPEQDGIYTAGLPLTPFAADEAGESFDPFATPEQTAPPTISKADFLQKSRSDHPAVLGVCGLLPPARYDEGKMRQTLDWVVQNWNWPTTWGWDYGMAAMAAARLGQPETAIRILLSDQTKNRYLVSGHNFQTTDRLRLYLPGNGALLTAVAMMCAGWDGCPTVSNPGFPHDGTWDVRWEKLNKMQ